MNCCGSMVPADWLAGKRCSAALIQCLPHCTALLNCPLQYNANLEARMKYADQPDRFMESEVG